MHHLMSIFKIIPKFLFLEDLHSTPSLLSAHKVDASSKIYPEI